MDMIHCMIQRSLKEAMVSGKYFLSCFLQQVSVLFLWQVFIRSYDIQFISPCLCYDGNFISRHGFYDMDTIHLVFWIWLQSLLWFLGYGYNPRFMFYMALLTYGHPFSYMIFLDYAGKFMISIMVISDNHLMTQPTSAYATISSYFQDFLLKIGMCGLRAVRWENAQHERGKGV